MEAPAERRDGAVASDGLHPQRTSARGIQSGVAVRYADFATALHKLTVVHVVTSRSCRMISSSACFSSASISSSGRDGVYL